MKPQISQSRENIDDNVFEINGINYKKNEDGKSLSVAQSRTKYNGTVNIPARVTFKGTSFCVTSIGDSAFEDCSGLNFVTIPDTVISIDDWAFEGCSGLTVVSIPDSVTTIGDWAFKDCSGLSSVTIPDSVTSIGDSAFEGCSRLSSVIIPDTITSIGESTFEGCSELISIIIPDSVTSIGDWAFFGCTNLNFVTIGISVTSIGDSTFKGCRNLISVTYNATNCEGLDDDSFCELGPWFKDSPLTTLSIGEGVKQIPNYLACGQSGLTSVTIPASVTSIGKWAFKGCLELASVTYNATNCEGLDDDSFCKLGPWFKDSPLTTLNIGEGVKQIPNYLACGQSGLTSITIPASVTSIGKCAFKGCLELTSVTYNAVNCEGLDDDSFRKLGSWFEDSHLTTLNIGNGVNRIPRYLACGQSGLTSITIPASVT
ncbi:MAG: leucine-rich repeat domain-containing protein, partial [Bacteroidales bacterium]|nr:leucine-rich repeat domain-containing protein [Bacteroidales bacterium]